LQCAQLPPQLGLAFNHLLGRIPIRPFLLVVDGRYPRPPKTLASDTDTITERAPATLDQIKEVVLRIDNNRAGGFVRGVNDGRAQIRWIDVRQSYRRNRKAFATNWPIEDAILASESGVDVARLRWCRLVKTPGDWRNIYWCSRFLTGPREAIVGSGRYTYKVHEDWAHVPAGIEMKPAAVAVDPHDRIYCFNRSTEHPVVVFDREGNFLFSWGAGMFRFPHAIRFDEEGCAWLTDGHHMQFMKFTPEGELLQTIGERGKRGDTGVPDDDYSSTAWKKVTHGGGPFNLPTDIAFGSDGSMFMSDGYGNARVHKFSADAKYLFSWGEPGKAPGQFNLPHGVWIDRRGRRRALGQRISRHAVHSSRRAANRPTSGPR